MYNLWVEMQDAIAVCSEVNFQLYDNPSVFKWN